MRTFNILRAGEFCSYTIHAEYEDQAIEIWLEGFWVPSWGNIINFNICSDDDDFYTASSIDVSNCEFLRKAMKIRLSNIKKHWINGF